METIIRIITDLLNADIVEGADEESVAQTKGSDTEVQGKDWTLVTGKASPRSSPGKQSESSKQSSHIDTGNTEVSPSRLNLLSIDEEEENLEEGEIRGQRMIRRRLEEMKTLWSRKLTYKRNC